MRRTIPLPEFGWSVRACGGMSHACVENRVITTTRHALRSIHTVLANAGIQKPIDPLRAELDSEWVGLTQWSASCEVTVPETSAGTECVLRLGTLDGACEVMLGEVTLGTHMSAFVPFEASVPQSLRGKRVRLELRFQAPVSELLRWQAQLGSRQSTAIGIPIASRARRRAASVGIGVRVFLEWGFLRETGAVGAMRVCWLHRFLKCGTTMARSRCVLQCAAMLVPASNASSLNHLMASASCSRRM